MRLAPLHILIGQIEERGPENAEAPCCYTPPQAAFQRKPANDHSKLFMNPAKCCSTDISVNANFSAPSEIE